MKLFGSRIGSWLYFCPDITDSLFLVVRVCLHTAASSIFIWSLFWFMLLKYHTFGNQLLCHLLSVRPNPETHANFLTFSASLHLSLALFISVTFSLPHSVTHAHTHFLLSIFHSGLGIAFPRGAKLAFTRAIWPDFLKPQRKGEC